MRLAWRSIISDNLDLFSFGMKKENKISGQDKHCFNNVSTSSLWERLDDYVKLLMTANVAFWSFPRSVFQFWCLFQRKSPEVFHKNYVLKNFEKFTRKHLCQSLFLQVFSF